MKNDMEKKYIEGAKRWAFWPEDCPDCGGNTEIYTNHPGGEGWAYDEDLARCCECGVTGSVVADGECAYVEWDDPSEEYYM